MFYLFIKPIKGKTYVNRIIVIYSAVQAPVDYIIPFVTFSHRHSC